MSVIVVGGIKGGAGKSTIATNLAVVLASEKKRVLLIDADEQRSCSDWADQREESSSHFHEGCLAPLTTISLCGKSIYQQIAKLKSGYDVCVVDTGGRDTTSQRSALIVADKFIIPFKPRSFDIWTIKMVEKLIEEISSVNTQLKSYYIINQGDSKGSDNDDAMKILSEIKALTQIPTIIGHRKAFSNAAAEGLGVLELKKTDKKAIEEIYALYRFIYE